MQANNLKANTPKANRAQAIHAKANTPKANQAKATHPLAPQSAVPIPAQQLVAKRPLPKWALRLPTLVRLLKLDERLSSRELAAGTGISKTTVQKHAPQLRQFLATCKDAVASTARKLFELLHGDRQPRKVMPDLTAIAKQLKQQPGQTRLRL